jgi:hypothetical protein
MNRKMPLSYGREGAKRLTVRRGGGGTFKEVVIYYFSSIRGSTKGMSTLGQERGHIKIHKGIIETPLTTPIFYMSKNTGTNKSFFLAG